MPLESTPDTLQALQRTEVAPVPRAASPLLKKQMPGLDILRGLAVLGVVCFHGLGWQLPAHTVLTPAAQYIVSAVHSGWLGVNLFFILSGFLITGILIDTRTRANYWKSFYVRRVLRILPLYLLTLFLGYLVISLRPFYILMCLLYAANMVNYFHPAGPVYGPFWSLAVEEQFYLVWPFIIRYAPRRLIVVFCFAILVASPVLRMLSVSSMHWLGDPYATTWLVSDNLAWGALIAIFLRSPYAGMKNVTRLIWALLGGGLLLFAVVMKLHLLSRQQPLGAGLQVLPFLLLFTALLLLALRFGDKPGIVRWSAPLRFFGYISYGLYLLHPYAFYAYDHLSANANAPLGTLTAPVLLFRFLVCMIAAAALCLLSRRYFEERFLRLKERLVPYGIKSAAQ